MGRRVLVAAALAAAVTGSAVAPPARGASAKGRWVVSNERAVPLEWFQGLTHGRAGARFLVGIFEGVTRTDARLRQQARNPAAIPAEVKAQYGFNHIGDPAFDRAHGAVLLPLECYVPGAPNGGNTCGRGGIGVLDPVTLRWRRLILLDSRDIAKAMWAEVSPDGRLLWTSSGPDLLAYRTADLSPAHAAPAAPIRPARRIAGAVPPGGITGAAFSGRRLLLAGSGPGSVRVWSVDTGGAGARRLELALPINAEAEGLDVLPTGDGLLHFLLTPFTAGPPTYGSGHSEIVSLVPRAQAQLRLRVLRRASRVEARVTLDLGGDVRPVAGAVVSAAGAHATTDARGSADLRVPDPRRRVVVRARKAQLKSARVTLRGAEPARS